MNKEAILSVRNLEICFSQYTKGLKRIDSKAINNLDIDLYKGEILAVVGSSGSGKSLLAHEIVDQILRKLLMLHVRWREGKLTQFLLKVAVLHEVKYDF